ncbi:MAG: ABC transporter substrate-binding protein [Desulfovibrio sp.]
MLRFMAALVAVAGLIFGWDAFASQPMVLVIHSYHPDLPWTGQCDQGIENALGKVAQLDHVYLDTKRIPESEFAAQAEAAMDTFRRLDPDLVMIGDDNALRLLGPRIAESGKPVVFFGINNNPRKYFEKNIPANVTGVLERVPLFPWLRHLIRIIPAPKTAFVLMDDSPTSRALVEVNFMDRKQVVIDGVRVDYALAKNWTEWKQRILTSDSHDFITMPVYHNLKDASGVHVPVESVIRWTSEHSTVPIFAYQDYAVGDDGTVGAYVIFGEQHASLAALMARDILEGKMPSLPTTSMDQQGQFFFNKKQLARFGLTLPEDIRSRAKFR